VKGNIFCFKTALGAVNFYSAGVVTRDRGIGSRLMQSEGHRAKMKLILPVDLDQ
jgi:hypothetical protein